MAISKEFLEAVSKDPDLEAEVYEAEYGALGELLKAKGLEEEAAKALEEAAEKVAAAHGFEPAGDAELDIDDLEGVSGGQKSLSSRARRTWSLYCGSYSRSRESRDSDGNPATLRRPARHAFPYAHVARYRLGPASPHRRAAS